MNMNQPAQAPDTAPGKQAPAQQPPAPGQTPQPGQPASPGEPRSVPQA